MNAQPAAPSLRPAPLAEVKPAVSQFTVAENDGEAPGLNRKIAHADRINPWIPSGYRARDRASRRLRPDYTDYRVRSARRSNRIIFNHRPFKNSGKHNPDLVTDSVRVCGVVDAILR